MSNYRDSYFQYHHLVDSHQALYNGWNQDELPPPDEPEVTNGQLKNKQSHNSGRNGTERNEETGEVGLKTYSGNKPGINMYWDYFHDEEDWNLFKNVQLESNGIATFNQPVNMNAGDEAKGAQMNSTDDGLYETSSAITGSIFNNKITRMALIQNSNWNDLSMPHPE